MAIYRHENFIPIEPGIKVWRYMDFEKFKSLLETQSLFFCRSDKFSDPFEGSLPLKEVEYRATEGKRRAEALGWEYNDEVDAKNIAGVKSLHQRFRTSMVVNCWHINNNESDAMWKLYLKDNEGVAVQSTVGRVEQAFTGTSEELSLSKVRYLDYEKDIWYHPDDYPHYGYNLYIPLLHKKIEFQYENEFRVFQHIRDAVDNPTYWDSQPNHKGKFIPVDIDVLVKSIYLPPTIDTSAEGRIRSLCEALGFNFKFHKSRLSVEPVF
jgi:hypothetical protein